MSSLSNSQLKNLHEQIIRKSKRNNILDLSHRKLLPPASGGHQNQPVVLGPGLVKVTKNQQTIYNQIPPNNLFNIQPEPSILEVSIKESTTQEIQPIIQTQEFHVYRIGDYVTERVLMTHLGIDIGTKTIVLAYRGKEQQINYISEINGYWLFERATPFIENMLNDPTKKRSDGTNRPARWIKLPSSNQICILGQDAEEFAYSKNDTIQRPMAEGGITPNEDSMTVLSSIVQGLIETAEHDIVKFDKQVKICYCTTAPAINKESNIDYHQRVINMILEGYETKSQLILNSVKESHAIVINESPDGTGIGISWGAGTVTVSLVKYNLECFSYSWVGAGDWIDEQVAIRHGYDPEISRMRKKTARETPTTVCKRKMDIDLTPGVLNDRVGMDIVLHYDVLINKVIGGIITGFLENESEARIEDGINIYMAGGTSLPKGFTERVISKFAEFDVPFKISSIVRAEQPLYCVASGCLKASEAF